MILKRHVASWCLGCALVLAGGHASLADAQPAVAEAVVALRPIVVLNDGTRLEPVSGRMVGGQLVVGFADGHTQSFPMSDVDTARSVNLPAPDRPLTGGRPASQRQPSGIRACARSPRLAIPEPEQRPPSLPAEGGTFTVAGGEPPAGVDRPQVRPPQGGGGALLPREVEAALQELAAAWERLGALVAEVRQDCGGYVQGRTGCGGSVTMAGRNTAVCRDAFSRAGAQLAAVEAANASFNQLARQAGLQPGETREVLRENGMDNPDRRLQEAEASVEAWRGSWTD